MVVDGKLYVSWVCPRCGSDAGGAFALADTPIRCTCGHVAYSDPL